MTEGFGRHGRCVRVAVWVSLSAGCLALGACTNSNVATKNVASRVNADRDIATEAPDSERVAKAAPVTPKRQAAVRAPHLFDKSASYSTVGTASWYGGDFHGKRTANGETYNMHALTAAHPSLPLRSTVRVTNLANHRSLLLRVNDRGPFVGNRLIDVSAKSAQLLGFYDRGLARVKVELVGGTTPVPTPAPRVTASAAPP